MPIRFRKPPSFLRPLLLLVMLCVVFVFMFSAAENESATTHGPAHIAASYGLVKYFDYRLNLEEPPLAKILSGVPLLFANLTFPDTHESWAQGVNKEYVAGEEFLYNSGNNAQTILLLSRFGPMLLVLLTILLIYFWSKQLMGQWWAFLPTILFAFSPTVLGHGHIVMTDVAATFGIMLSLYTFTNYLLSPRTSRFFLAGLALGLALLAKFSTIVLIPLFVFLSLLFAFRRVGKNLYLNTVLTSLKKLLGIFFVGGVVVYVSYMIFMIGYPLERQVSDTRQILQSSGYEHLSENAVFSSDNIFVRPVSQYLLGTLMVPENHLEEKGLVFFGKTFSERPWYYFPLLFAFKETIPALLVLILGGMFTLWNIVRGISRGAYWKRFTDYLGTHFPEFSMILSIVLYPAYVVYATHHAGFHILIPILPLLYILGTAGAKAWMSSKKNFLGASLVKKQTPEKQILPLSLEKKSSQFSQIKVTILSVIVVSIIVTPFVVSPFFLSYFNLLGGGTFEGYKIATNSNYDLGQDLTRLSLWVQEKNTDSDILNDIEALAIEYSGGGDPEYYLGETAILWDSKKGDPRNINIEWIAISANTLSHAFATPRENSNHSYEWLREIRNYPENEGIPTPDIRIGTSIFLYHL